MQNFYICPVCGYDRLPEAPYDAGSFPSFIICDCCGFEFGFDKGNRVNTYEKHREAWAEKGFPYYRKNKCPQEWSKETMLNQLKNISKLGYTSDLFNR